MQDVHESILDNIQCTVYPIADAIRSFWQLAKRENYQLIPATCANFPVVAAKTAKEPNTANGAIEANVSARRILKLKFQLILGKFKSKQVPIPVIVVRLRLRFKEKTSDNLAKLFGGIFVFKASFKHNYVKFCSLMESVS